MSAGPKVSAADHAVWLRAQIRNVEALLTSTEEARERAANAGTMTASISEMHRLGLMNLEARVSALRQCLQHLTGEVWG